MQSLSRMALLVYLGGAPVSDAWLDIARLDRRDGNTSIAKGVLIGSIGGLGAGLIITAIALAANDGGDSAIGYPIIPVISTTTGAVIGGIIAGNTPRWKTVFCGGAGAAGEP